MSQTPSPSTVKTSTTRSNSGSSTNRILTENIETPSPSTIATSRRTSSSFNSSPLLNIRTKIQIFKKESEEKKNEATVVSRTPILTKEILEKAAKIEESLKAHKESKTKFQLSYLLSPKKLKNYKKEKKIWKSQDPVNLALEEHFSRTFSTPSPKKMPKKPAFEVNMKTDEITLDQKLNREVIEELAGKFKYTLVEKSDV
uniref:Uncharacterized protein n=1 Tax=Panagrolaimus sp. PS1159 TaxID=55785 RepID=A0AC35G797_9BILA